MPKDEYPSSVDRRLLFVASLLTTLACVLTVVVIWIQEPYGDSRWTATAWLAWGVAIVSWLVLFVRYLDNP